MKLKYLLIASLLMLGNATQADAAMTGQHSFAQQSALAEGKWLKVSLNGTEDGIYQISYDWLRNQGFANPEKVGVYGFGGHAMPEAMRQNLWDDLPAVAIKHDTENQRILFYGQGTLSWNYNLSRGFYQRVNTYDTKAYYFLHESDEQPRQMEELQPQEQSSINEQTQYDVHWVHEVDDVNLGKSGREKYGESFINETSRRFDFETVNPGSVRVTVNFVAYATETSTLTVSLNGNELGVNRINRVTNDYAFANETTFDKAYLLEETSGLSVNVKYTKPDGITPTVARLNYVRIQAKRDFTKPQDFELFRSSRAQNALVRYDVSPALDEGVEVWDVSDPCDIYLQRTSAEGKFCPSAKGIREYALVNTRSRNFPTINSEGYVSNQNLHALPQTDMVIVTAPAFLDHAQTLAEYRRQHDGLHVTVLTPEEIYNEFSSGKQDITAIRLLMKMFYDRYHQAPDSLAGQVLQPRYLLLWGDGYYDNIALDRARFLPSYESDASLVETSSYVCDDYFGFLDDNEGGTQDSNLRYTIKSDGLDIGIGRIPANTREQSAAALNKIINYGENRSYGTWKNQLCFLSDDDKIGKEGSDAPNCHVKHNDMLVSMMEANHQLEFVYHKIYLPAYKQTTSAAGTDYPDAKKEFNEALKQGVLMVNYAGHGNTNAITNENMMTAALAQQLSMKYLPLWVTASCDVSRWDEDATSMGECLFLNPNGGAIALISTVRVVYAQQNLKLNIAIIDNIFKRFNDGTRYKLGDVLRAAKLELGSDENKLNFCLLGDPSLTLAYPEQKIEVTSINGQPANDSDELMRLPALSQVTVKGRVLLTGSTTETDSLFNGLLYPTFYDAADSLVADKGLIQDDNDVVTFTARTKKAFAGRSEIRNGEFEFTFTVPLDLNYGGEAGLANFYACSETGAEASGYYNGYVLTGSDDYTISDTTGPEICELFLNSKDWQDGDVVNSTPYFYAEVSDESGFNATGNTVGHDIMLTIRCTSDRLQAPQQHTLNNYFTTFTDNPKRGNVQYSMPELEDGTYEASFRVWDVYNNPTTRKFTFTVQSQKAPEAVVVQAYPCPVRVGDTITFRVLHNRPESAQEINLQVFTQTGYKVYETTVNSNSAAKVYANDPENPTDTNNAINADESSDFMGSAVIEWNTDKLRPGFYLYRVFLSSNGSTEMSKSQLLMVNP